MALLNPTPSTLHSRKVLIEIEITPQNPAPGAANHALNELVGHVEAFARSHLDEYDHYILKDKRIDETIVSNPGPF